MNSVKTSVHIIVTILYMLQTTLSKISASNLLQKELNSLSIGRPYSYYLKFEDLVKFHAKFVSLSPHNTSQAMQQIREVLL